MPMCLPCLKKGSKKEACNYRPVSLTSVPCKIMGHIIFHHIMGHLDAHHLLVNYQHGFRQGHSCESQLITIVEHLATNLDHGKPVLDFQKKILGPTGPQVFIFGRQNKYSSRQKLYLRINLTSLT